MKMIASPDRPMTSECDEGLPTLFLSGGITGAPNWQPELLKMLEDVNGIAFNPRQPAFDMRDPDNEVAQIEWEAEYLASSDAVSFWFPKEAACQITLYELGRWTEAAMQGTKELFVAVEAGYRRSTDIRIQTRLALPNLKIVNSLEALAGQIREWASEPRADEMKSQSAEALALETAAKFSDLHIRYSGFLMSCIRSGETTSMTFDDFRRQERRAGR